MTNRSVRRIFLIRAGYILLNGMFFGNILGIGLGMVQQYTGIIQLDKESYYMDTVPVFFDAYALVGINLLTLVFCILTLILPTLLVTRITPLQAVRMD